MINQPPLNELMKTMDSKYTLAIVAAKRARRLVSTNPELAASGGSNPVSLALQEVAEGHVTWAANRPAMEIAAEDSEEVSAFAEETAEDAADMEEKEEVTEEVSAE